MKNFFVFLLLMSLLSCDDSFENNDFLPNVPVNFTVNLNLSEGLNLQIPGGQETFLGQGIRGVVIYRLNLDTFVAFDLACPHLELQSCSTMTVDALFMTCPCDNERFQLTNGASEDGSVSESARFYTTRLSGNILTVNN